jgi:glycosyltransferase involved in cell wall biosynthesis
MRALFAYDHKFLAHANSVYSENHFGAAFWDRYLDHFECLTVIGRRGAKPAENDWPEMLLSSRPEVSFEFVANQATIRGQLWDRRKAAEHIDRLVQAHDAVIARLPSEVGLLAASAARRHGVPLAVEVVGCPLDAYCHHGSALGKFYSRLGQWRMRRAVSQSTHAIYVTRDFLQRRYPAHQARTETASNVELPELSGDILARRLERIAQPGGPLRLGLIGSLRTRTKGIQTVIAALAAIKDEIPNAEFRVLGGGDKSPWKAEAASAGVAELVHFDGSLPTGDPVLGWLDQIDLYLQPSFQEGLPRALIEAMSRGCPALGSDLAGIPELLPAEDLIVPGDHRRLAQLILARARDEDWLRDRASRNFACALEFQKHRLDQRRSAFWREFLDHTKKRLEAKAGSA